MSSPKLLDQVRIVARVKHYSRKTEDPYVNWIKRFILFHSKRHPKDMAEEEIRRFLAHLAVDLSIVFYRSHDGLARSWTILFSRKRKRYTNHTNQTRTKLP